MKEKVTIIVPVYNGAKTITRCLNSLLSQSYQKIKILIVNDGSTDSTSQILKKLYSNNEKITIYNQENKGVSAARNLALKYVETEYVAFVDADDFVDSDFILNLVNGFSNKLIDLSINGIKRYDSNRKVNYDISHYSKTGILNNQQIMNYVFDDKGPKGYLCNKMWKMEIIKRHNLKLDPSIKMAEDLLFTVNYLFFIDKAYINNYCGYNYVHSNNSLSSGIDLRNNNLKFKESNVDYINSYSKIINTLSKSDLYVTSKEHARANLGLIYTTFLRQLNFVNTSKKSLLYKQIRTESLDYFSSVIKSKDIKNKSKVVYIITVYFPKVMLKLDKFKNMK